MRRDPKLGQKEGDWFAGIKEIPHEQIIGFCRNRNQEGLPPQIILSDGSFMLAEGESIDNIMKQQEDAEKKKESEKFDFVVETVREGLRRQKTDNQ